MQAIVVVVVVVALVLVVVADCRGYGWAWCRRPCCWCCHLWRKAVQGQGQGQHGRHMNSACRQMHTSCVHDAHNGPAAHGPDWRAARGRQCASGRGAPSGPWMALEGWWLMMACTRKRATHARCAFPGHAGGAAHTQHMRLARAAGARRTRSSTAPSWLHCPAQPCPHHSTASSAPRSLPRQRSIVTYTRARSVITLSLAATPHAPLGTAQPAGSAPLPWPAAGWHSGRAAPRPVRARAARVHLARSIWPWACMAQQ